MFQIPISIQKNIDHYQEVRSRYDTLNKVTNPLEIPSAPILGRDTTELRLNLRTPEKANIALIGEPGVGKTAFVQAFAYSEDSKNYLVLSVNVERIVDKDVSDKDAALTNGLNNLVDDVSRYVKENDIIVVLFIDEFHRLPMLSESAVEALKPVLEKSAHNGFRIIGATTFEEYEQHIAGNRALDQRLLRMSMPEVDKETVLSILKVRAKQYQVDHLATDTIYEETYNTSKEILISNSQPRASIDIFNSMIGTITKEEVAVNGRLVRTYATPQDLGIRGDKILSRPILNRVIRRAYGIDIDNKIRVKDVEKAIRQRIFNQKHATNVVIATLQRILAGFIDPTRPRASLMFTGPTGTGKTEMAKVVAESLRIPMKRFDMSRYSRPEDAVAFGNDLAQAAWSQPNALILIDEIEKSSREAVNNFLQVLDDARLTSANNPNRVISFTGNIIFITTNVASEIYEHERKFDTKKEPDIDMNVVYKALSDDPRFETAVLGRLDDIAVFLGLPNEAMEKIATKELTSQLSVIESNKRKVIVAPDIIPHIVIDKTSENTEHGGARDAKRNVRNMVIQKLASYLAEEPDEVPIILYLSGQVRFKNKMVVDPNAADVEVVECYPQATIDHWMNQIQERLRVRLFDDGIYVPKEWTPHDFATAITEGIERGYRHFVTHVDVKTDDNEKNIWIKGEKITH